jgi:hypothetical protein
MLVCRNVVSRESPASVRRRLMRGRTDRPTSLRPGPSGVAGCYPKGSAAPPGRSGTHATLEERPVSRALAPGPANVRSQLTQSLRPAVAPAARTMAELTRRRFFSAAVEWQPFPSWGAGGFVRPERRGARPRADGRRGAYPGGAPPDDLGVVEPPAHAAYVRSVSGGRRTTSRRSPRGGRRSSRMPWRRMRSSSKAAIRIGSR